MFESQYADKALLNLHEGDAYNSPLADQVLREGIPRPSSYRLFCGP